MHPEELLDRLKSGANARKGKNLEVLNEVCRKQFERGSKDFTIATIGRLSEENAGPATQSLRNKTGDDFKALVSAWANYTGGSVKREPRLSENPLYAILEKIPDPAVRAVVGAVLAENKKLKGEVNLLKRNAQVVIDQRPLQPTLGTQKEVVQTLSTYTGLTESEKDALKHATSDKLIQNEGWQIDEGGRVLNAHGRAVFKVGFVTAIRKVLSQSQGLDPIGQ
jgi:hypothetical protein